MKRGCLALTVSFRRVTMSLVLGATVLFSYAQRAGNLVWLGTTPNASGSAAWDVSADGRVVVGILQTPNQEILPFRRQSGNMQIIGSAGYGGDYAWAVSASGEVVVGAFFLGDYRGFYWRDGQIHYLISPDQLEGSWAHDVSADGRTIVGWGRRRDGTHAACIWEDGQPQFLSPLLQYRLSRAFGVSSEGGWIVGWVDIYPNPDSQQLRAFLVPRATRAIWYDLGDLGGGQSIAFAVSDGGQVVVGTSVNANYQTRPFRWTWQQGMMDLGAFEEGESLAAYSVSADGSIVVGGGLFEGGLGQGRAFRWSECDGLEDLNATYARLLGSSRLLIAASISPDGRFIVGTGYNAETQRFEGFLLDTCPLPGDVDKNGEVDDQDVLRVLFKFGEEVPPCTPEDLDKSGLIDDSDLLIVLFNFGNTCPPTP